MFIYVLKDPDTDQVCYVGKTNNPKKRLSGHLSAKTGINLPSVRWIRKLKFAGKKPVMEIIEESENWEECEKKWIFHYRQINDGLLNIDDGGIVSVYTHISSSKLKSKKYMSVILRLSNLPKMSKEATDFWKLVKELIKTMRSDIYSEMGVDALKYFDDCIYDEFINKNPRSFRILA